MTAIWSSTYGLLAGGLAHGVVTRSGGVACPLQTDQRVALWCESERHPLSPSWASAIEVGPESLVLGTPIDDLPRRAVLAVVDITGQSRTQAVDGFRYVVSEIADVTRDTSLRAMIGLDAVAFVGEHDVVESCVSVLDGLDGHVVRLEPITIGESHLLPRGSAPSQRGVRVLRNREFVRETVPHLLGQVSLAIDRLRDIGLSDAAVDLSADASNLDHAAAALRDASRPDVIEARTVLLHQEAHAVLAERLRALRSAGLLARPEVPQLALAAADGYATAVARRFGFERARVVAGSSFGTVEELMADRELLVEIPGHLATRAGSFPLLTIPVVGAALDPDGARNRRAPIEALEEAARLAGKEFGAQVTFALERFGHPSFPTVERRLSRAAEVGVASCGGGTDESALADVRSALENGESMGADPILAVEALLLGAFGTRESYVNEAAVFCDLVWAR